MLFLHWPRIIKMIDFVAKLEDGTPPSQAEIDREKARAKQSLRMIRERQWLIMLGVYAICMRLLNALVGHTFLTQETSSFLIKLLYTTLILTLTIGAASILAVKGKRQERGVKLAIGVAFFGIALASLPVLASAALNIWENPSMGGLVFMLFALGGLFHYLLIYVVSNDKIKVIRSLDAWEHSNEKLMQEFKGKPLLKRYFKALDSMDRPATNGEIEAAKQLLSPRVTEGEYIGMKFGKNKEDRVSQRPLAPPPSPTPMSKKVKHTNKG